MAWEMPAITTMMVTVYRNQMRGRITVHSSLTRTNWIPIQTVLATLVMATTTATAFTMTLTTALSLPMQTKLIPTQTALETSAMTITTATASSMATTTAHW